MNNSPKHFWNDGRGRRDVFLNGEKLEGVVYANTAKGFVRVVRKDYGGNILLNKNGDSVWLKTLRGNVEVIPK